MGGLSTGLAPEWLALREDADAAARAADLLDLLPAAPPVIHDLGCGTGSMGRWLAGRLPGPQHWVLHDRAPALLAEVVLPRTARDGHPVRVSLAPGDLTQLRAADLTGASLVTASALLDLLTADEIDGLASVCAGLPVLITLSVLGRVVLDPADPLDGELEAAFNAHQRRVVAGRRLLGPDAYEVACTAFGRRAVVLRRPSPWRLGPPDAVLIEEWLRGWVSAAVARRPALAGAGRAFLSRRLEANAAGELRVVVAHGDLLAVPS